MPNPTDARRRHRLIVSECSALIDLLDELHPADRLPALNATDREIGSWHGKRDLIAALKTLRQEALQGPSGSLPKVIGGR